MKNTEHKQATERASFSGNLGYILAVAGSAVGLGNIWRFPYLAAKYGGGMFLLVYLILLVTFGYALMISETALGRMTGKSPVGAFQSFGRQKWLTFGGWINAVIPILILPYYSVIGGWVVKYAFEYLRGNAALLATDGYFGGFIADSLTVEICFAVFVVGAFAVIAAGVKNGIETVSKIIMPLLVILAVITAVYSVTRPGALAGVRYLLVPHWSQFSLMTVVAAVGQLFYSLSLAMGILYTYGSYLPKESDIEKNTTRVELFDTGIAILAGLMIIPAVFAFSGGDMATLKAGPSLMFITLPKVFDSMGFSNVIGSVFFIMVLFAALTSAISLFETSVSTITDETGMKRLPAGLLTLGISLLLGTASVLGYGAWDFVHIFGMQILDFFDFLTNSLMMPVSALFTCLLVLAVTGKQRIAEEVRLSSRFRREALYNFVMQYLAPVFLIVILLSSIASVLGWIQI
ncbi:MAG: sodium-dependent transporter [Clostridia bacterium]|nr:sodium-dependent transporter [Clostridia bacterium]MBQ5544065.1 sodium-dependent transporter [Clostridia bacterium]